ncbi:MAG: amidohydrolase family protein, partial [Flammeovirgaceae bacterium]|nr:amidohydrolase family protein [Flammeovirgaceae bacterium]MDW8287100.1 amidohydrolase family protein [Flammeovirgaceae bacterium]
IIPPPSKEEIKANLKAAEQECLQYGLTTVTDAGLPFSVIQAISEMQQRGQLAIRISAMALPTELPFWQANGKIIENKLRVHSVKIYADGALGSRGACLLAPYTDAPHTKGFLLKSPEELEKIVNDFAQLNFQINTHCIGDSANRLMLTIYGKYLKTTNDKRWRIEHAQVVHPQDFELYRRYSIIPSMQPTHATSDMYWAKNRLGKERLKSAYALKDLMNQNGIIALGSDFPVESVNPFLGIYAAVVRKDTKGFPTEGFQMENALDRISSLKGMTIWAAYATFWEKEIGSLEVGKWADFIITTQDIMEIPADELKNVTVKETWIAGKRVFKK